MTRPRIPCSSPAPHEDADAVRTAIDRVLESGWFILGPEVAAFEAEFAAASGTSYAVTAPQKPGAWYWRVRANRGGGLFTSWSQGQNYVIGQLGEVQPGAVPVTFKLDFIGVAAGAAAVGAARRV